MTETTNAEKLRIGDGFVVWIIGASVEETSLLDPMPEGAEMIEERDEDEPENVDAAIMVSDNRTALAEDFDEVLPQLGSIPIVWITYPSERSLRPRRGHAAGADRRLRLERGREHRARRDVGRDAHPPELSALSMPGGGG